MTQLRKEPAAITNDVLCELAHELAVRECAVRRIEMDVQDEDETRYSPDAQLVFDAIYDIVTEVLESYSEVQP